MRIQLLVCLGAAGCLGIEEGALEEAAPPLTAAQDTPLSPGCPRPSAGPVVRFPAATSGDIRLSGSDRTAGAIDSLTVNGCEYLNSFDHGRQLQTAVIIDACGENFNPTEAGGYVDDVGRTSTSALFPGSYVAAGNVLQKVVRPSFWLSGQRPGYPVPACGVPQSFNALSNYQFTTTATIVGHVIRYDTRIDVPRYASDALPPSYLQAPSTVDQLQVEAVTPYLKKEFSTMLTYDPATGVLRFTPASYHELGAASGDVPIASTENWTNAMGVFNDADPIATGGAAFSYGIGYFRRPPSVPENSAYDLYDTAKLTSIFRFGHIDGPGSPTGIFQNGIEVGATLPTLTTYIAVGHLRDVVAALGRVHRALHHPPLPESSAPARELFQGLFMVSGGNPNAVYFDNGSAFCMFASFADYQRLAGRSDVIGVPTRASFPRAHRPDGLCN